MNGIVNFRRRRPFTRFHQLIIILAVLAVVAAGAGFGSLEHPTRTTAKRVATVSAKKRRNRDWCVISIVRRP